jgi:hypothetical protein
MTMRLHRMFALPFACLALFATLTFFSPASALDYGPGVTVAYDVPDLALSAVHSDHVALVAERQSITAPADAHAVAYAIANQPLSTWRIAVGAYAHIDPGRALA